ncbi:terminase large subunit domain-containing protein [Shewanella sp. NIFS-20-20]|uniref:terminase large subunit domain-containing protein n=1 Tax=Shewanella sp. NIFS-20-20 TaxID=2853806 RepID=UPI001C46552D|nr:terminase family protein [Shewanella sp. NIFS-20-20]MBV7315461.1 terminase family protein [Shewanella sp. NIFS-20-20]
MNQPLPAVSANDLIEFDKTALLLGYQKRWIADTSVLKIAEKSRRTGLTFAEAADSALSAGTAKGEGGNNVFYVGSNKEMAREFIDAVALWAKMFDKAAGEIQEDILNDEDKDILTFVIYFESGFKVQALSSNPSNLRGMQGTVIIDEAAFHERLAEVLKAALALTMWGSKVRLISTHNGIDNLFNTLINDSRAGKKRYSVHSITLDDACNEGLYQRICQVTKKPWSQALEDEWKANLLKDTATEEDALEEYYCVPKNGGGAYISRGLRERAAILNAPVLRFTGTTTFNEASEHARIGEMQEWLEQHVLPVLVTLPPDLRHALGEDFARSGDLTVFAPITVENDTKRTVPFLVELKNVPFKQQEQALYFICDRLPRRDGIFLDARGNGQYLAEQARYRYGAEVVEVMLSVAFYRENMPRFKAAFEDNEIILPKHEDVITDLGQIQIYRGVPGIDDSRTKGSDGNKRHGDSAIAIFLGYLASKADLTRYELHTIKATADESQRRFFGSAAENNRFDDTLRQDLRGKGIRL